MRWFVIPVIVKVCLFWLLLVHFQQLVVFIVPVWLNAVCLCHCMCVGDADTVLLLCAVLFSFFVLHFHQNFACVSLENGNKCDRLATLVQCAEWLHFVCGWVQFFINLTKGKKAYSLFSVAAQCQLGVTLKHCSKAVCTVVFAVVEVGLNMGRAHN